MIEAVNQKFMELMGEKLPDNKNTKAVIGWFYEELEEVVSFGDFGSCEPDTMSFQIGSVTKLFTATLASIYVGYGKLDLKDQIGDYLKIDANSTIGIIKIEDLLTHHSGLPRNPRALLGKYDHINPYKDVSKEKLMAYLNAYRKPLDPKCRFKYSNLGFSIIGCVLEELSGKTYEELVIDEICKPLGIKDLWISKPGENITLAPGAMKKKKELPRWELNAISPAGAIDANIRDMLKFAKGNLVGHSFYPKSEICHQIRHDISKHMHIGLGWIIVRNKEIGELHTHNGATGAFNSFIGIHPEGEFGLVMLTNCSLSLKHLLGFVMDHASAIGLDGLKHITKEYYKSKKV